MKVDISMKEIFVYIVRKWKIVVAFALVLSVAIGWVNYTKWDSYARDEITDLTETFASADGNASYVNRTVKLSLGIDLTNFIGTSADSYHLTLAKNDILSKILNRYLLIAQGAQFTEILKDIIPSNISEDLLHDNIRVESTFTGVIDIFASGFNNVDPNKVASATYDYLLSFNEVIGKSVAEHTLAFIASSFVSSSGEKSLLANSIPATVPSYISSALITFIAGLIVAALVTAVLYLVLLPIQVPDQFQQQLGIRYIGGFRKNKFLSLGDKLAGSLRIASEGEAISMIYANLKDFVGDHTKILLTGSIEEQAIKEFADKLTSVNESADIVFIVGANVNKSASSINALTECDAVVLVERIGQSRVKHIKEEKDRIDMSGKDILGYVLY